MTEAAPGERASAVARSQTYRVFAQALEYPDEGFRLSVEAAEIADALDESFGLIDPELRHDVLRTALCDGGDPDALAAEYTRLFDVGPSGPPCPLYGGLYTGSRAKTMDEALRFYHHFGLGLSKQLRELPDQLGTQLEFLHFLAYREACALEASEDAGPYQRAQRDFLKRHPGRWVPKLRERLEREDPMPFYREIVRQLDRFLGHAELI